MLSHCIFGFSMVVRAFVIGLTYTHIHQGEHFKIFGIIAVFCRENKSDTKYS